MRALGDDSRVQVHVRVGGTSFYEDRRIILSGVHVIMGVGDGVLKSWLMPYMSLLLIYGIQLLPCFLLECWRLGVGAFDTDSTRRRMPFQ